MNRRTFLKRFAGGAAGLAVSGRLSPLFAQASGHVVSPGVSADEIKIGMVSPFSGSRSFSGSELYRGSMALFQEVNAKGGIFGRQINTLAMDDGGNSSAALRHVAMLAEEVFMFANMVGESTLASVLPLIRSYGTERANRVMVVGPFSGSQTQREAPYRSHAWNVRPGRRHEMQRLVDDLVQRGYRRFGVFYSNNASNKSGPAALELALSKHGLQPVTEATSRQSWTYEDDTDKFYVAVDHLRNAGCDFVVTADYSEGAHAFIHAARNRGWRVPISITASTGPTAVLNRLIGHNTHAGINLLENLVLIDVVPTTDSNLPAVALYRQLMDKWNPQVPANLADATYTPARYSTESLEGFLNARVAVDVLRLAGPDLYRGGFYEAAESLNDYDIGLDQTVTYADDLHQGLKNVYLKTVSPDGSGWVPLTDWNQVLV